MIRRKGAPRPASAPRALALAWTVFRGGMVLGGLPGCDAPEVVDCLEDDRGIGRTGEGRFVTLESGSWCVYPRSDRPSACPSLLPQAHELPMGALGCAKEPVDPVPTVPLCLASGVCDADGGAP